MAARPLRRLRRELAAQEQGRPPEPDLPAAGKSAADMTPAELDQFRADLRRRLREAQRPQREAHVRAGRRRPRNIREAEMFGSDLVDRRVERDNRGSGTSA